MKKPKPVPADTFNNTLTPEDVGEFWAFMDKWQAKLSLHDWRIHHSPKRCKSSMAEMHKFDAVQRSVSARLGLNWKSTPVLSETLEQTAVHELLHVLLFPFKEAARENKSEDDILAMEHAVINVLERLLVPDAE